MSQLELSFMEDLRKEEQRQAELVADAFRGKLKKMITHAHNYPTVPPGMTEIMPGVCQMCGGTNHIHWPGCELGDPDPTMLPEGKSHERTDKKVMEINLRALNCHLVRILRGPGTVQFPNGNKLLFDEDGNAVHLDERDHIGFAVQNPDTHGMHIQMRRLPHATAIIEKGAGTIELPSGDKLTIAPDGQYALTDTSDRVLFKSRKAFVTRSANSNAFRIDQYLLTSDALEEFIKEVGELGVTQDQLLNLPIETFINWLVIKAAERDDEPIPEGIPSLEQDRYVLKLLGSSNETVDVTSQTS